MFLCATINLEKMSCLISFVKASPNCQQRKYSEKFKMKYVPPRGIEPTTPCFPACNSNHSAIIRWSSGFKVGLRSFYNGHTSAVGYIKRITSFSHQSPLCARVVHKFHTFLYGDYATRSTWLGCA